MKNHVIVCGAGHMGMNLIRELSHLKQPFVVIEKDFEICKLLLFLPKFVEVIHGNVLDNEILLKAGIQKASLLVSTFSDPKVNEQLSQRVQSLNSTLQVIVRGIQAPRKHFAHKIQTGYEIAPQYLGTLSMLSNLVKPAVLDVIQGMFEAEGSTAVLPEVSLGTTIDMIPPTSSIEGFTSQDFREMVLKQLGLQTINYYDRSTDLIMSDMSLLSIDKPDNSKK